MFDNIKPHQCDPPGTFWEVIPHFGDDSRAIEKAVIMEHRFAFFFWMKWRNALQESDRHHPPTLITIDWHRDLAPPTDDQKTKLEKLDQSNFSDVANYVWAQFDQTNDGHILCAAWLNLVGDVIVLKNAAEDMQHSFTDMDGNEHHIFEFRAYNRFEEFMLDRDDQHIFFDIDLDYFIHGKGQRHYSENFSRYTDEEIKQVISYSHPAFQHFLPKVEGMTIALEPGYCGGISNSCQIMEVVHSQLFDEQGRWLF